MNAFLLEISSISSFLAILNPTLQCLESLPAMYLVSSISSGHPVEKVGSDFNNFMIFFSSLSPETSSTAKIFSLVTRSSVSKKGLFSVYLQNLKILFPFTFFSLLIIMEYPAVILHFSNGGTSFLGTAVTRCLALLFASSSRVRRIFLNLSSSSGSSVVRMRPCSVLWWRSHRILNTLHNGSRLDFPLHIKMCDRASKKWCTAPCIFVKSRNNLEVESASWSKSFNIRCQQ